MFKFIQRLFAQKPKPSRPQAIRRQRINPVYFLEPEHKEGIKGSVKTQIKEVRLGNDGRSA